MRLLAVETGLVALQRGQARNLHQVLVVEIADAGELLLDQRDLLVLGLGLRGEAGDFLVQLGDTLGQLRLLARRGH